MCWNCDLFHEQNPKSWSQVIDIKNSHYTQANFKNNVCWDNLIKMSYTHFDKPYKI